MSAGLLRETSLSPTSATRSLSALPLSIAVHVLVLLAIVVIPLLATDTLPLPYEPLLAWMPVAAPPAAPSPVAPAARVTMPAVDESRGAPVTAPTGVRPETGIEPSPVPSNGLDRGDSVVWSDAESTAAVRAPVDVPPPPPPDKRVYVTGGQIKQPIRLVEVQPVYPELAKQARVEGLVIVQATIGPTGDVEDVRVLRSQPLLDEAAVGAVRQWKFSPTLLNGTPVSVSLVVTVRFTLH